LSNEIVITPCHWHVGIDHIRMDDPKDLALTEVESKALFATVQPYFLEDGIELTYDALLRWFAKSPALQNLELASLDRVIGRNVDVWQPQSDSSKSIRRLQNEVQMLLYTHPVNEARETKGWPTVNSFWMSRTISTNPIWHPALRDSALRGDWQSWMAAWQRWDASIGRHARQITLCGERNAHTYAIPATRSIGSTIKRLFKPTPTVQSVLSAL
jgi:hypothetical protein